MAPFSCFDQCTKNFPRGCVFINGALGMPLHGKDEVVWGGSFQGFDDIVLDAAGDDAQAIADGIGGLMMRGVHGKY